MISTQRYRLELITPLYISIKMSGRVDLSPLADGIARPR